MEVVTLVSCVILISLMVYCSHKLDKIIEGIKEIKQAFFRVFYD